MTKIEKRVGNRELNLEQRANVFKPQLTLIKDLKKIGIINKQSPLWWETDYASDPREHMDFKDFKKRLVHLGKCSTTTTRFHSTDFQTIERDVYLYPEPKVPMTILNLEVSNQTLPFLVTARPYHEKERFDEPISRFLIENPDIKKLSEYARTGKPIDLWNHFYPHLRGLFAGAENNHLFWYPVNFILDWCEFGGKIREALGKKRLGFLGEFKPTYVDDRTYSKVWDELTVGKDDLFDKRPVWVNFDYEEVSKEEFAEEKNCENNLLVYYPLRMSNILETLPILVSNRTNSQSNNRKPAVLGVYAENGGHGYAHRGGILRIKDLELAKYISSKISEDFEMRVDTVLFTPQKGRPKYERISG